MARRGRKKTFFVMMILVAVAALLWMGAAYTGSDSFCASCHAMAPFVRTRVRDEAHAGVRCVTCHEPPGFPDRLLARFRFVVLDALAALTSREKQRFSTRIPDRTCLRKGCHRTEDLDMDTERRSPVAYRSFRHMTHFDPLLPGGMFLACTACHAANPKSGATHFATTLDDCLACHLVPPASEVARRLPSGDDRCLQCHSVRSLSKRIGHMAARKADKMLTARGLRRTMACTSCHPLFGRPAAVTDEKGCLSCHEESPHPASEDDPLSLHRSHVMCKRAQCRDCHPAFPHMRAMNNINTQMDCRDCHGKDEGTFFVQAQIYGGRFTGFSEPDPMAAAGVSCQGCHRRSEKGCSSGLDSCGSCHPEAFESMAARWQETIEAKMRELRSHLDTAVQAGRLKAVPPLMQGFLDAIAKDGSLGVHNIHDVNDLLDRSINTVRSYAEGKGK